MFKRGALKSLFETPSVKWDFADCKLAHLAGPLGFGTKVSIFRTFPLVQSDFVQKHLPVFSLDEEG